MQIRIARTREDQEPGERDCAICRNVFWLGEATAWAITDDNTLLGGGLSRVSGGWRVPHRGEVRRTGAAVPRDRGARRADRLRERRGCSQCGRTTRGGDLLGGQVG